MAADGQPRVEGPVVESAKLSPCLKASRVPSGAGFGQDAGLPEGILDLFDAGAVALGVAGGVVLDG